MVIMAKEKEEPLDEFNPTLGKRGTSKGIVIPKKWILLTRLKEALLHGRLVARLESKPGDPLWAYRIVLEVKVKDERKP